MVAGKKKVISRVSGGIEGIKKALRLKNQVVKI